MDIPSRQQEQRVGHFRQILLWPLQLMPLAAGFQERHYNEFVTFLPYVQQFLYGEGRCAQHSGAADAGPPMRVFRRRDIARCASPPARATRR
jgi:hypothetical protein